LTIFFSGAAFLVFEVEAVRREEARVGFDGLLLLLLSDEEPEFLLLELSEDEELPDLFADRNDFLSTILMDRA
jgi:hypothetical protein